MTFGPLLVRSPGSVTDPSSIGFTPGSALDATFRDYGHAEVIPLPSIKGVMILDGISFVSHAIGGVQHTGQDAASYVTGPLAPSTAPTTTSTGSRATATQTLTAGTDLANDDVWLFTNPQTGMTLRVRFKSTLSTTLATSSPNETLEIKRGGGIAATIASVAATFNGTGTQGVDYFWADPSRTFQDMLTLVGFNVPTTTATVITYRAVKWGVHANSWTLTEVTDSGGSWAITNFSGGADGTHANTTFPSSAEYVHAYADYRTGDKAQTAVSPTTSIQNGTDSDMTVGSFWTPPTRDGVTHKRAFRSTGNGGSVLYKEADTTGSSYTDSLPDSTLIGDGALLYDATRFRPYGYGYPDRRAYGAVYRGAVFATGVVPEAQRSGGTVAVTKGSKTVTFTGGRHKENVIGMTLRVANKAIDYRICDFTESTQVGLLSLDYADGTDATASYTLRDERNPYGVGWCVPNKPNQWPIGNLIEGVSSSDGRGTTGIKEAFDSTVLWTREGLWQIQGDPITTIPRFVPIGSGVGCYTGAAVVSTDASVYWLGPDGIFGWGGSGLPSSLSNPQESDPGAPRGIQDTLARINEDAVGGIVSDYNRTENVIRWFVPMDGSTWNSHVIVYDTQTGAFTLDTCPAVTCAASVLAPDGSYVTLVGTALGEIIQLDLSTSDGAFGFDPLLAYSSFAGATNTTTVGASTLPTTGDGLKGVAVVKVTPSSGAREKRYVSTNTSSTFATTVPFSTDPTTGDVFVFGGIEWNVRTGRCDYGLIEMPKRLASLAVSFTPQDVAGQVWCAGGKDDDDPRLFLLRSSGEADFADLSEPKGRKLFVLNTGRGLRVQFELLAIAPGFDVSVAGWKAEIPVMIEVRT